MWKWTRITSSPIRGRLQCKLENPFKKKLISDTNRPDIGSGGPHVMHNASHNCSKATRWKESHVLNRLDRLFKDNPARREDFTKATGRDTFTLRVCQHRWTENVNEWNRVLSMWPDVQHYSEAAKEAVNSEPKSYGTGEEIKLRCWNVKIFWLFYSYT